jgi:ubiquinone biosynthesis protein COQ4
MQSAVTHEDELRASRSALTGTPFGRAKIASRALFSLLKNPDDTRQVFLLGTATGRRALPELLTRMVLTDDGSRMIREQPSIDSRHVDYDALRALPDGTLGREYVRFLDDNHLDPDLFQAPPGLPQIPAYLAQRMRQTHDIWHVLTGYTPDVPGEVALQAFSYAQTRTLLSLLIAFFGSLHNSMRHPGIIGKSVDGYRRGKKAVFLASVWLEEMWALPLDEVRARLAIDPVN